MTRRIVLVTVLAVSAVTGSVFAQRGTAPAVNQETAIVPFKVQVPDAVLADLKQRLARTRFPGEIAGSNWDYGTNLGYLKELVTYWRDSFDWRAAERRLNQFNQFTTTIDGLDIHFIHQRSKNPNALALAVTHGWPGSVVEFGKIIGPLTEPCVPRGGDLAPGVRLFREAD
jgi:hypothetical protein